MKFTETGYKKELKQRGIKTVKIGKTVPVQAYREMIYRVLTQKMY